MAKVEPVLESSGEGDEASSSTCAAIRGTPAAGLLPHLLDAPENDRWMHIARIVGPFGEVAGWNSFGWNVRAGEAAHRAEGSSS